MNEGDRWIAAQNVERFEKKLQSEGDPKQRKVLRRLLKREKGRLRDG